MSTQSPTKSSVTSTEFGAQTIRVGLVGRGIQGSRSPKLHTQEAAAQGFGLSYSLIDLDTEPFARGTLAQALDEAQSRGFAGVNITYPFKQDVLQLVQELSPDAERLGAVNTV